jgi:hypothetical protein
VCGERTFVLGRSFPEHGTHLKCLKCGRGGRWLQPKRRKCVPRLREWWSSGD